MANSPAPVRQAEVTRYVKAVAAAGIQIGRITIAADGTVEIYPAGPCAPMVGADNPWDRLLHAQK